MENIHNKSIHNQSTELEKEKETINPINDIINRINKLEKDIYTFSSTNQNNRYTKIPVIKSQIIIINTLLEMYEIPNNEMRRYNEMYICYTKLLENDKLYVAVDRKIRLEQITKDTQNIIQTQEYIDEVINMQSDKIDQIEINMIGCDENMTETIDEMEQTKRKAQRRIRFWRYFIGILLFGVCFTFYKSIN